MYNPRPEAFTVLTAMAARTQRVRLGTAVLIAALRHPVWLADVMASVDLISKGRLVVGVGVGANFTEAQRDDGGRSGRRPAQTPPKGSAGWKRWWK